LQAHPKGRRVSTGVARGQEKRNWRGKGRQTVVWRS
jgi:hypothetical protein